MSELVWRFWRQRAVSNLQDMAFDAVEDDHDPERMILTLSLGVPLRLNKMLKTVTKIRMPWITVRMQPTTLVVGPTLETGVRMAKAMRLMMLLLTSSTCSGRGRGNRAGARCSSDSRGEAAGSNDDGKCERGVPFDFISVRTWRDSDSPPSMAVGFGSIGGKWPPWHLVINSLGIPVENILDEIAVLESDSGGGGDTEEIITDEDGDEVVAKMEVDAVEAIRMLRRTREEAGKAPMVMEDVETLVPIFDRLAGDLGAESTRRVTLLDYEEFLEDEDVFEAKLEEPGIAAMVFEARAWEAEQEELLRCSEPEVREVLMEFEREAAGAEIVPRVSAM
ncbi:hypothetical protein RHSIM_Rhsim05G0119400 [Rhododendron simsii]|uniref:Uncharacterized protein n=1 Tax=Rhododendron simsii TaxID=118357 RepID=A0A834GXN6_RHOSS|nr:hypothetical protein RHSIM_Rhsim05G0119400 [Rhododendron simsii]